MYCNSSWFWPIELAMGSAQEAIKRKGMSFDLSQIGAGVKLKKAKTVDRSGLLIYM